MRRILWKTLVKEKKKSISKAFIVNDNRTGTFDLKLRVNQELHSHQRFPAVKNHGNVAKTADFIGMERSALHRKLKTLGIKGIN